MKPKQPEFTSVLAALKTAKINDMRQQRHFIGLAIFAVNNTLHHLAKQYNEAKHVAKRLSEDEKPEIAAISFVLKVDFTNLDHLSAELDSSSKALKLKVSSTVDDDLSQLTLNFDGRDIVGISGEATPIDHDDDGEDEDAPSADEDEDSGQDSDDESDDSDESDESDEVEETDDAAESVANTADVAEPEAEEPVVEEKHTMAELKYTAKELGIIGYSKMKRDELITLIKAARDSDEAKRNSNIVSMPARAA